MILRSNKLGVQVNGNILRIATVDSLAKEAETEKVINDAKLENTQLVTEFIRLNYARATGVLSQAGGSSGNFAGGGRSNAGSSGGGGASGAASGGTGHGSLPGSYPPPSPRGYVETKGRRNPLISSGAKE